VPADVPAPTEAGRLIPRLVIGLGNPGAEYRDTRHNIGFMVVDELARRHGTPFQEEKRHHGLLAKFPGGWLLKPQTYMNDSGRSARSVAEYFKIPAAEILPVYDDVDLPLGRLRLRLDGSAGGHNGIKSLIQSLGTTAFPRLKVGIAGESGRPDGRRLVSHVLGKFQEQELPTLALIIQAAADAITVALSSGFEAAMNRFNRPVSV
jgi:PTH1 family peptidyl-tRNA hydrolase